MMLRGFGPLSSREKFRYVTESSAALTNRQYDFFCYIPSQSFLTCYCHSLLTAGNRAGSNAVCLSNEAKHNLQGKANERKTEQSKTFRF